MRGWKIRHRQIVNAALILAAMTVACAVLISSVLIAFSTAQAERSGPQVIWNRTYAGGFYDYGSSVRQTGDGGFVIAGGTGTQSGGRSALLIKTDGNGSVQWRKAYRGDRFDYGNSVIETLGGGYVIAGVARPHNGSGDVCLVRTDADGNVQWERTYGGSGHDEGRAIQQTSEGGFIVAGSTASPGNGSDIYLIKTDQSGNVLWEKTYGGAYDDLAVSIERTRDGGYIAGGYYGTGKDTSEAYLLKVDARGVLQWEKRLGGPGSVVCQARQTGDRGYIAAGHANIRPGNSSICLFKTDRNGTVQWQKTITAIGRTLKCYNVYMAPDSGYVIVGESGDSAGKYEGLVLKTDAGGNVEWQKTYGADRDVFIRDGAPTGDGGLVLVGSIGNKDDVETRDVYLLRLGRI